MTREEIREFYEEQVQFYTKEIEWHTREIKWYNEQIKKQRAEDREFLEWIWARGVLDRLEMEMYTDNYESSDMRKLKASRSKEYRRRKQDKRRLVEYQRLVKEWA